MGAGPVCLTQMCSWQFPDLSMGERKDSHFVLDFCTYRLGAASTAPPGLRPLPAPTPGHPPWQGRLPLAGGPAGHSPPAEQGAGAHADAAKTGSLVAMGKPGPVTREAR